MAAIAVDRFTSLAQPLRYNNLITHRSVERYIAGLWLYAGLVGTAPLAARVWGPGVGGAPPPAPCSGAALLRPPGVAVFLLCAVYAPCMVLVVGCYSYVYLVARNHHRAIYSVEVSLRHGHDAPYASRYTSTLAITVGFFVCLWLPFQMVIVVDLVCGSHLVSSLRGLCLSLPMFASSALNPWVYGYRNGEVRAAVQRVLGEMLTKVGLSSPHLGCPHLVTTGADAELNSFASNVRLCTLSFTATHTLATPTPTRCCTTTNASLLHPDDAILLQSPQTPSVDTPSQPASPSTGKAASSPLTPPAPPPPPSRTLRALAGHAASHTAVITLAQTVIELRVPVQVPNAAATSLNKVHHV
ncbi:glucose-dependent insulinotropic receptor-like [Thrips palmi]|uniref:Glucose-dependent insulinotropic receptor-like n=1 Tax=Thrips palmi TaxID=161013 RepID=A0A6P8ZI31_THRPL|nr:glucose-dependent insulinotropic receptor-like [Thrips palmi]